MSISESCYWYKPLNNAENQLIADWLLRLTQTHKRWGFGLCYFYLRNTKGFGWNHRGKPSAIRCDNGPEYVSQALIDWANEKRITLLYIQPGKPTQNAYVERFNRTARHEWLDLHDFESVGHAQMLATEWLWIYNNERPHTAVGGFPPATVKLAA